MAAKAKDILGDLQQRELVSQLTSGEEFTRHLQSASRTVYCGFDPTAESLHIGSLVPLLALRRFQLAGHKPIAVVGGATGLIGDPSFKAAERSLNSAEIVQAWVERLKPQLQQFLDFDAAGNAALLVNNLDWTRSLDMLGFLRDIGKHFSINAMIQKESVKQRIDREGEGISYTEFSYMILQSYDFAELYRRYGCTVQVGGSDQWGNITGGIDLTRRLHQAQVYGMTLPLVTKADGSKFGKTETGTVWLSAHMTSPYAFYQFWLNVADADVYRFLKYFTFLPPAEILALQESDKAATGKPEAQGVLAREVTRLVHGDKGLEAAQRISQALFTGEIQALGPADLAQLELDGLPSSELPASGCTVVEALVSSGLAKSNKMAREFIASNAVSLNGQTITDIEYQLLAERGLDGRFFVLRRGKKLFHLAKLPG